ncbi:RNA polymerase subunit sigma [Stutzerimonas kirkiae]|uniref:RNA polymerase subunit sigma n=1 Tax=Stutzerimonas kirkiae TaxID=2211392 RepID=A0A4Q9QXU5_9GAMM|nr:RNA polymerase subunit sigma [Stutzerimonas kirkiae]TBU99617.1 RNA polymerase subunit sigma [Stutzerimonas kirkiae]
MPWHEPIPRSDLDRLYRNHNLWLQGWLRRQTECPQLAADLMQDTYLRILASSSALALLRELREPRNYLTTVARRVLFDRLRRQRLERAYLEALAIRPEYQAISTEERVLILDRLREIDRLLDGCGARAKQAFLMAQCLGMSYVEIAQRLGVSLSSVKKYMVKATERCLLLEFDEQP